VNAPFPDDLTPEIPDEMDMLVSLPGFQGGGLVQRTGIALVHEGEYITPAPGSEAAITTADVSRGGPVINYYFPVEVVVIGTPEPEQMRSLADFIYEELQTAFEGLA
jgi:hypothetical protein